MKSLTIKHDKETRQVAVAATATVGELKRIAEKQFDLEACKLLGLLHKVNRRPIKNEDNDVFISECILTNKSGTVLAIGTRKECSQRARQAEIQHEHKNAQEDNYDAILDEQDKLLRQEQDRAAKADLTRSQRDFQSLQKRSWSTAGTATELLERATILFQDVKQEYIRLSNCKHVFLEATHLHRALTAAIRHNRTASIDFYWECKGVIQNDPLSLCREAAMYGRLTVIERLAPTPEQCTDLVMHSITAGHLHVTRWLHARGAVLEGSHLVAAARHGRLRTVEFLQNSGLPFSAVAVEDAMFRRHNTVALKLLAAANQIEMDKALLSSIIYNNVHMSTMLLQDARVNIDVQDHEALLLACGHASVEMVQLVVNTLLKKREAEYNDVSNQIPKNAVPKEAYLFYVLPKADSKSPSDCSEAFVDKCRQRIHNCIEAVGRNWKEDDEHDTDTSAALGFNRRDRILRFLLNGVDLNVAQCIRMSALQPSTQALLMDAMQNLQEREKYVDMVCANVLHGFRFIKLGTPILRLIFGYILGTDGRSVSRIDKDIDRLMAEQQTNSNQESLDVAERKEQDSDSE